jgi:hypothetical protein
VLKDTEQSYGQLEVTHNYENTRKGIEFPLYVVMRHHWCSLFMLLHYMNLCERERLHTYVSLYIHVNSLYVQDCERSPLSQLLRSYSVGRQNEDELYVERTWK